MKRKYPADKCQIDKKEHECPFCGEISIIVVADGGVIGEKAGCEHFGRIPAFTNKQYVILAREKSKQSADEYCWLKARIARDAALIFLDVARDLSLTGEQLEQKCMNDPALFKELEINLQAWRKIG